MYIRIFRQPSVTLGIYIEMQLVKKIHRNSLDRLISSLKLCSLINCNCLSLDIALVFNFGGRVVQPPDNCSSSARVYRPSCVFLAPTRRHSTCRVRLTVCRSSSNSARASSCLDCTPTYRCVIYALLTFYLFFYKLGRFRSP